MSNTPVESRFPEPLSGKVVETVAALKDTEPAELDQPLYTVIDPDALDTLFTPKRNGMARTGGEVQFTYCGYSITVTATGVVNAVPIEE